MPHSINLIHSISVFLGSSLSHFQRFHLEIDMRPRCAGEIREQSVGRLLRETIYSNEKKEIFKEIPHFPSCLLGMVIQGRDTDAFLCLCHRHERIHSQTALQLHWKSNAYNSPAQLKIEQFSQTQIQTVNTLVASDWC